MLAVKSLGGKRVEVAEKEMPRPKAGEVLVRVRAAAICGSDRHGIYNVADEHPYVPGHEVSGEIAQAVKGGQFKQGARVCAPPIMGCGTCWLCRKGYTIYCENMRILGFSCDGGQAEYVAVPDDRCLPLPDDVSFEAGALIGDPIGGLYHSFRNIELSALDTIGVFGVGPMGLGGTAVAKFMGARVICVDTNQYRLDLAMRLGADFSINPQKEKVKESVLKFTHGAGLDKAVDCAGTDATLNLALDLTRKLGKVAIIGENQKATINPSDQFNRKEISLHGSTCFNIGEYGEIIDMIRRGLRPERIVTHRFSIKDAAEAYRLFDEGKTGKVVFTF